MIYVSTTVSLNHRETSVGPRRRVRMTHAVRGFGFPNTLAKDTFYWLSVPQEMTVKVNYFPYKVTRKK